LSKKLFDKSKAKAKDHFKTCPMGSNNQNRLFPRQDLLTKNVLMTTQRDQANILLNYGF
jgi:hypothetical protein